MPQAKKGTAKTATKPLTKGSKPLTRGVTTTAKKGAGQATKGANGQGAKATPPKAGTDKMDTKQKIQIVHGCTDKNVSPSISDATRPKCNDIIKKLAQSVKDPSKKTEADAAFKTLYDKDATFKKFADKRLGELRKAAKPPAKKIKGAGKTTKGAGTKGAKPKANAAAGYDDYYYEGDYYQNDEGYDEGYDGYDGYSNEYDAASWSAPVVGDGNSGYSSYDIQKPPHPHVQRGYGGGYGSYGSELGQDYSSMIMSISLVFNVVLFSLLICAVGAICVAVYGYFICKMHKNQRFDLTANKDYAIVANREEDNEPEV